MTYQDEREVQAVLAYISVPVNRRILRGFVEGIVGITWGYTDERTIRIIHEALGRWLDEVEE